jgi:hypothetical protein
MGRNFTWTNI